MQSREGAAVSAVDVDRRERIRDRVVRELGPEGVLPRAEGPAPESPAVAAPGSDAETAAVLRLAGEEGWRVLPVGARSSARHGPGPDLELSSRRRRDSLGHEPGDLVVTVQAGVTLGELDHALRGEGQWLPLDPPAWRTATVGGAVATGLGGPLAPAFGRPRDQVLGLTLVDGQGRILELGGRVVKNVAGFDLVRLAVGSRGTVGVITSVSFRLYPVPGEDRTLVWDVDGPAAAWDLGRSVARLPIPLAAVEVMCPATHEADEPGSAHPFAPPGPGYCRVVARVLGSSGAVDRMVRELGAVGGAPDHGPRGWAEAWASWELAGDEAQGKLFLRARSLPDRGGSLLEAATTLAVALRDLGWEWPRIALRPGTGELRLCGAWNGGAGSGSEASDSGLQALAAFREAVEGLGGTLRVLRLPSHVPDARTRAAALSTPAAPGVEKLRRELREAFDPRGIFPGAWREGA